MFFSASVHWGFLQSDSAGAAVDVVAEHVSGLSCPSALDAFLQYHHLLVLQRSTL